MKKKIISMDLECGGGKEFHICVKNPKHANKISVEEFFRDNFRSAYHVCFPYDADVYIFTDEYIVGLDYDTAYFKISHCQNGREEKLLNYGSYLCDSDDYEEYKNIKQFYHEQLKLLYKV